MADVPIDALRLLIGVADHGSISAAARHLRIAQPSASTRLQQLERSLGLRLVDRRARGAELTPEGRAVTSWARSVTGAMDALLTGASALREDRPVRVAASQTIAEFLVPSWLGRLHSSGGNPVHLTVANTRAVLASVRDRSAELGFVEGPAAPKDLATLTLRPDRLMLIAAPGHPLARRTTPVTGAELVGLPLVCREEGSGTRHVLARALEAAGVRGLLEPEITVDSNAAVKVLLLAGTHVGVLSELAVAAEIYDGRLVEVPTVGLDFRRQLRAIWRKGTTPRATDLLAIARPGFLGVTTGLADGALQY